MEKLYPALINYDPTEVDLREDDAFDASEALAELLVLINAWCQPYHDV